MTIHLAARVARTAFGTATTNTLKLPPLWLQSSFMDPRSGQQRPLPPHRWVFEQVSPVGAAAEFPGGKSDENGHAVVPTDPAMHQAGTRWALRWEPWGRTLPSTRVIWLDLDTDEWVADADLEPLEKRPLVRLRAWQSTWKAARGGFFETPRGDFDGTLGHDEVLAAVFAHGREARALRVRVDHGLHRSYVRFRHWSFLESIPVSVPPALRVHATDASGNLVGGGVAIRDDGLIYVLHERTPDASTDSHLDFEAPDGLFVDLSTRATAPRSAVRISPDATLTSERYPLPRRFHTLGWDLKLGDTRHPWPGPGGTIASATTTRSEPFEFNLDDTVLVDRGGREIALPPSWQVTVLDQLVRVRDPDAQNPHLTSHVLNRNYLEAERFIVQPLAPGQGGVDFLAEELQRQQTLAIETEGNIHLLGALRHQGQAGRHTGIGLREARPNELFLDNSSGYEPMRDRGGDFIDGNNTNFGRHSGCYELHLLPSLLHRLEPTGSGAAVRTRVYHLLAYLSIFIRDDFGVASPQLRPAALIHSTYSPSKTETPAVHMPTDGFQDGDVVVFSSFLFTRRSALATDRPSVIILDRFTQAGSRGHWDGINRSVRLTDEDVDGRADILAHELGHAMDLPDEYLEGIYGHFAVSRDGQPLNKNFRVRPFVKDHALMGPHQGGMSLRYLWHHLHALEHHPPFASHLRPPLMLRGDRTFRPPDESPILGGATTVELRYRLPSAVDDVTDGGADGNPWFASSGSGSPEPRLPNGHCRVVVTRLGADEYAHFLGSLPREPADVAVGGFPEPADGVAVVASTIRLTGLDEQARVDAASALAATIDAQDRYVLEGDAATARLKRIGLFFQAMFSAVTQQLEEPNLRVLLIPQRGNAPHPLTLPPPQRPSTLALTASELASTATIRHMLGIPTMRGNTLLTGPISATEIESSGVLPLISRQLGEPPGVVPRRVHSTREALENVAPINQS